MGSGKRRRSARYCSGLRRTDGCCGTDEIEMNSMTQHLKSVMRPLIRRMGYDIRRFGLGQDAYLDIKGLIGSNLSPVIFDVGANVGQTIDALRETFPRPTIHAFEPSKA